MAQRRAARRRGACCGEEVNKEIPSSLKVTVSLSTKENKEEKISLLEEEISFSFTTILMAKEKDEKEISSISTAIVSLRGAPVS